jgi:3-hydroxy acid dehydrogenase / malonic semialdehyde reductase
LYKHKIRVSAVHPGMVEGAEFSLVRFDNAERAAAVYADIQPLTIEDVANTVYYIAAQPAHVNIQEVLMYGSQQAGMNHLDRSGR